MRGSHRQGGGGDRQGDAPAVGPAVPRALVRERAGRPLLGALDDLWEVPPGLALANSLGRIGSGLEVECAIGVLTAIWEPVLEVCRGARTNESR